MLLFFGCLFWKRRYLIGKYLIWCILNVEKYEKKLIWYIKKKKNKIEFIIEIIFFYVMLIDVLKSNMIFNSNIEIKK